MPSVSSVITRSSMSSAEGTSAPIKLLASLGVRYSLSSSSVSTCFQSGSNLSWVANSDLPLAFRASKDYWQGPHKLASIGHIHANPSREWFNRHRTESAARHGSCSVERSYSGVDDAPGIAFTVYYQSAETGLIPSESISLRMV